MNIKDMINPRQTVLVTSRAETSIMGKEVLKDNIITIDWHMPISVDPPYYAISIGEKRFSLELIRKSKVFGINFMPSIRYKEVLFCGRNSGQFLDKFEKTGLSKTEGKTIDTPLITEATAFLECHVEEEKKIGDHYLIIGKVLTGGINSHEKRTFHVEGDIFTTTR